MTGNVAGKVVLVTGAARGIGAGVARELARRGARLSLVGLEPARLRAVAAELGEGHVWFECDVTDQCALNHAVAGTLAAFSKLDVVVANAGIAGHGTFAVTPIEAAARTVDVNLTGVLRTVSATLEHVAAQRGYYLVLSSAAAIVPVPGLAVYGATKLALEHFAAALRIELVRRGVDVGVAHPSWIDTDLVRDFAADLPTFEAFLARLPGPFGRVTSLDECAQALADGVARRQRKVHVPRSLLGFALLRSLLWTGLGERLIIKHLGRSLTRLERDVHALGRPFGASSVETKPATRRAPSHVHSS
jgi:NAD(P)-dependent dehydrogenase (short-subunit alcohol dehydrogenase family)